MSYTCFLHPAPDQSPRSLDDLCPVCGRRFDFPLLEAPRAIRDFKIVRPLARGFYGATYEATYGRLARRVALKVVPCAVYEAFQKDFEQECQVHHEIAVGTEHVVDIEDFFDEDVTLGGLTISCHIAVLDYVGGELLDDWIVGDVSTRAVAQVAVDLLTLLAELESRERYHNDLHGGNIIVQGLRDAPRTDALDPQERAIAIDLGSVTDESRSGGQRAGDVAAIATHLLRLSRKWLNRPDEVADLDYRIAETLDELGHMLSGDQLTMRRVDFGQLAREVQDRFFYAASPWKPPAGLRRFADSYNAQTLDATFIPRLLVDPDGRWLAKASTPGPQVITGIRGCGKTMLLRALQFQARAASSPSSEKQGVLQRMHDDGFVGLYVNCNRLLDRAGGRADLRNPYERLFLAYAREALRVCRQLRELGHEQVLPHFWQRIGDAVADYITGGETLREALSDLGEERRLHEMLASLERGEGAHELTAAPAVAFPVLAEALRSSAAPLSASRVLFLLDDVSTRHLEASGVAELLSTLMFSHELCAFKLTSEVQTTELLLKSPGMVEHARAGRDYDTFDLGGEVNDQLRAAGKGFIAKVLERRADMVDSRLSMDAESVLGDVSLEQIARDIASSSESSPIRKSAYRGISALAAVCVGDIGDVIELYDRMLELNHPAVFPIPATIQTRAYSEYSSRRLFQLNRRGGRFKDFALAFARAHHQLLVKSYRGPDARRNRLRQYNQLYVRITTGDTDRQFEQLRELMDAGVFVFEGGPERARTKTRDSDPLRQFIFVFRKLYGLGAWIGLAQSDRFELSGDDLQRWLDHPAEGEEILTRRLGFSSENVADTPDEHEPEAGPVPSQLSLSADPRSHNPPTKLYGARFEESDEGALRSVPRKPILEELNPDLLAAMSVGTVVAGLGFEDRSLASASRLSSLKPDQVCLVRYPVAGYGNEIREHLASPDVSTVEMWPEELALAFEGLSGPVLMDVTGLAKPVIFNTTRSALRRDGEVYIVHTRAESYYPLNEDIQPVLEAGVEDPHRMLEAAGSIWVGEDLDYRLVRLIDSVVDDSRRRLLLAAVSPKHQRLLTLLDERAYDRLELVAPDSDTPRGVLARLAADVAARNTANAKVHSIDSDDLGGQIDHLAHRYKVAHAEGGFDVEAALTGSKLHAVAVAALSCVNKFAECWYVRPAGYDPDRFTRGVGTTRVFKLSISRTGLM